MNNKNSNQLNTGVRTANTSQHFFDGTVMNNAKVNGVSFSMVNNTIRKAFNVLKQI